METKDITWEDLKKMNQGKIIKDYFDEGIRILIVKGPSSLCAYMGISESHPLGGKHYDDLCVQAHGGLTFSGTGMDHWPKGYYWYGLDYSHSGDYSFYYDDDLLKGFNHDDSHKWLPEEVEKDLWMTIYDFKKLVKLAESIKNN